MTEKEHKFISGIGGYFFKLRDINVILLKLKELKDLPTEGIEKEVLLICDKFSSLFPVSAKKKKKRNIVFNINNYKDLSFYILIKNKEINKIKLPVLKYEREKRIRKLKQRLISISEKDGIFLLSNSIKTVNRIEIYKEILSKHYALIYDIKMIRNKREHEQHLIERYITHLSSGDINKKDASVTVSFLYKNEEKWVFEMKEFIDIIIEINNIFLSLQDEFKEITDSNNLMDHPYVQAVININLNKYNKDLMV